MKEHVILSKITYEYNQARVKVCMNKVELGKVHIRYIIVTVNTHCTCSYISLSMPPSGSLGGEFISITNWWSLWWGEQCNACGCWIIGGPGDEERLVVGCN